MSKIKNKRLVSYQHELLKSLKNPRAAVAYLNAALMDEDPRIFLIALKNVIDAQGYDIADIAQRSNLNRENLYRVLSRRGNPRLTSIVSLLNSVGLNLSIGVHKK